MRADALHRLLASPRGASALVAADIAGLPDLASWDRLVLDVAIADLVTSGALTDDGYGRIHLRAIASREASE